MLDTFRRIWKFSRNRRGAMIRSLLFSFLRSAFSVTQLLAILAAVRVLTGDGEAGPGIIFIGILTVICILGSFLCSYFEQSGTLESDFYMTADRRLSAGNVLRRVPLGFFQRIPAGKIAATLTTTLAGVETAAAMVMVGIVSGLFQALAFFLFMVFYEAPIGLLTGLGMAAYLLVVRWQMRVSEKQAPALQKAQRELAEGAITFLRGIRVTKACSFREGDRQLREKTEASCRANKELTGRSMPSQFAAHLTVGIFESLLLAGALYLGYTGRADTVKTVVLMLFSFMAFASLNQAGSMLSMIGLLNEGLAEAEEIEKARELQILEPHQTPESGEIEFHHVSFSYGDHQILRDISARMEPRSLTAIVGPSGSGKTTLCQLIPRFRDVDGGSITLGGADIRHIPYEELMKQVSMVFQNVWLFEDTILNNIRFGKPEATLEEVRAAARAARCDDFIMALPQGYDTPVEEGGSSLSGGEKQRISIARAILKDAPIIILDEATSALDGENEHLILEAIDALTRNKTVIMIAHRLRTVEKARQILVLEDAQIVERGTHRELLKKNGRYADFVRTKEQAMGWTLRQEPGEGSSTKA